VFLYVDDRTQFLAFALFQCLERMKGAFKWPTLFSVAAFPEMLAKPVVMRATTAARAIVFGTGWVEVAQHLP